jgi:hypothetical protein
MVPRVIAARDRFYPTTNGPVTLKFELPLSRTQASLRQPRQRVRPRAGKPRTKGQFIQHLFVHFTLAE